MVRAIALAALAAIMLIATVAGAAPRNFSPGQEELIADAVGRGAKLPDGCVWAGAFIDRDRIKTTYTCGPRSVALEIVDREGTTSPLTTRRLAILAPAD